MPVARFWRDIPQRYNLYGSRCGSCGKVYFPTRFLCPACRRTSIGNMESIKLKGQGNIYSFSLVHDAPDSKRLQRPYAVAMIDLDEGLKVTGEVVDVDFDKIEIGMRVRAILRKLGEEGPGGIIHYGFKFIPVDD